MDADVGAIAAAGVAGPSGTLPFIDEIQGSFGRHDVRGVGAHVGAEAQTASAALGAHGYATGNDVAFAAAPDLHLAAHEAAHVVQQRAGVQLASAIGEAGDPYERHADRAADAVVRGESAAGILDEMVGGGGGQPAVQREEDGTHGLRATMMGLGADLPPDARFPLLEYGQQVPALRGARGPDRLKMLQAVEPRRAHALLKELELDLDEQFVIYDEVPYLLGMASLNTLYPLFEVPHGRSNVESRMFSKLDLAMQLDLFERMEVPRKARLYPFGARPAHQAALLATLSDGDLTQLLTLLDDDFVMEMAGNTPPHVAARIKRCIEVVRPIAWAAGYTIESDVDAAEREGGIFGDAPDKAAAVPRTDDELLARVMSMGSGELVPFYAKVPSYKRRLVLTVASPAQLAALFSTVSDGNAAELWLHALGAAGPDTITAALRRLAPDQVKRLHFQLDPGQQAQLVGVLPPELADLIVPPEA